MCIICNLISLILSLLSAPFRRLGRAGFGAMLRQLFAPLSPVRRVRLPLDIDTPAEDALSAAACVFPDGVFRFSNHVSYTNSSRYLSILYILYHIQKDLSREIVPCNPLILKDMVK